jgi:glyoxylase-like metal-dependent hydrolase (beta-lactamase superfamily II)
LHDQTDNTIPTDQPWFAVRRVEPDTFIIEEPHHDERVKCYLIEGRNRALLLDTGMGVGDLRRLVDGLTDRPVFVVNSHAHWDHIGGDRQFDEIWIHSAEAEDVARGVPNEPLRRAFAPEHLAGSLPDGFDPRTATFPPVRPTGLVTDGQRFDLGGRVLETLHCPGHSPGGIVLLDAANGMLFSTDVAYAGALYVYRPADLPVYERSLARLAALPDLRAVYPSHNASPIDPALLSAMRDGVAAIIAGRAPSSREDDMVRYDFDGFAVQVWGTSAG